MFKEGEMSDALIASLIALLLWFLAGFVGFLVYPGTNSRIQATVEVIVAFAGGVLGGLLTATLPVHVIFTVAGAFAGSLVLTTVERLIAIPVFALANWVRRQKDAFVQRLTVHSMSRH